MAIRQREGEKLLRSTQKEAEEVVRNGDQGRIKEKGAEPSFASTVMGDITCTYTQICAAWKQNQPREMIDGSEEPCSMGEEQTLSLTINDKKELTHFGIFKVDTNSRKQ